MNADATQLRPAWVEIDLDAVAANTALACRMAGSARMYVVCKGDGYGTGAVEIGRAALAGGADALAVGSPLDAIALRRAGITCPILLYACSVPDDAGAVAALDVIVTVHDFASLGAFAALGRPVDAFVKLDCGLGRLGFNPDEVAPALARMADAPQLRLHGLYAHLARPEEPDAVERQMQAFTAACATAERMGFTSFERMVASSRVLIGFPQWNLTAVNPGRFILGMLDPPWADRVALRPVVRAVKARIIQVKDQPPGTFNYTAKGVRRAAVLPIGFGEGFPHRPPCHHVLVRGRPAPVLAGRGIEHTVIDVTSIADVAVGDEAVLLGSQGDATITATALSEAIGVPILELLPRLARNAPQRYLRTVAMESSPPRYSPS